MTPARATSGYGHASIYLGLAGPRAEGTGDALANKGVDAAPGIYQLQGTHGDEVNVSLARHAAEPLVVLLGLLHNRLTRVPTDDALVAARVAVSLRGTSTRNNKLYRPRRP